MAITLNLSDDQAAALLTGARQSGITSEEYALLIIDRALQQFETNSPRLPTKQAAKNVDKVAAASEPYLLYADRTELLAALRSISAFKKRTASGRLKFSFADGELNLSVPGADISIDAYGTWPPLAVYIKTGIVWALGAVPPVGDPVEISYRDRRIGIGTSFALATCVNSRAYSK